MIKQMKPQMTKFTGPTLIVRVSFSICCQYTLNDKFPYQPDRKGVREEDPILSRH